MQYNFNWFDPQLGTPIVSVARYGLTFSRSAVQVMGIPEYVMLGYDKDNKVIGVKVCGKDENLRIPFASKERSGNVRINNKDFIRYVVSNLDNETMFDKNAVRFTGLWDEEQKILIIDLKKPLNGDDEEQKENNE